MKTILLAIGFAVTGLLNSFAQGQGIPLTVDSARSSVDIIIDGAASSSQISGTATFDVQASGPPSGNAQLTELNLTLDQGLSFRFFLIVSASSSPGDVTLEMVTPGAPGLISGNTFDQLANTLALGGELNVSDPFNVAGGNQTFDLSEIELGPVDIESVIVTQAGNAITVSASAVINETIDLGGDTPLVVDLTLVASGEVPETFLLGDVNLDNAVSFLDIAPFILRLSTGEFQPEADIDQNEAVTFLDIAPFISLLSGQ